MEKIRSLFSFIFLVVVALASPTPAFSGIEFGNGGDGVLCAQEDGTTHFEFLDWALARKAQTWTYQPQRKHPYVGVYEKLLAMELQTLAYGFAHFTDDALAQLKQGPDYNRRSLWVPENLGAVQIDDESLHTQLPQECRNPNEEGVDLRQAVVRERLADKTKFRYDPSIVQKWFLEDEINLGFLLVHEWLWNYAENASSIRAIAGFLLSEEAASLPPQEALDVLLSNGFRPEGLPPVRYLRLNIQQPSAGSYRFVSENGEVDAVEVEHNSRTYVSIVNDTDRLISLRTTNENRRIGFDFLYPNSQGTSAVPVVLPDSWRIFVFDPETASFEPTGHYLSFRRSSE